MTIRKIHDEVRGRAENTGNSFMERALQHEGESPGINTRKGVRLALLGCVLASVSRVGMRIKALMNEQREHSATVDVRDDELSARGVSIGTDGVLHGVTNVRILGKGGYWIAEDGIHLEPETRTVLFNPKSEPPRMVPRFQLNIGVFGSIHTTKLRGSDPVQECKTVTKDTSEERAHFN